MPGRKKGLHMQKSTPLQVLILKAQYSEWPKSYVWAGTLS